jgi:dTDP-4-dehydrorhamnose reductase
MADTPRPTIMVTGADGQVGWELRRALAPLGIVRPFVRDMLDLADIDAVRRTLDDVAPGVIVNAAAYTAVDRAESEPEAARKLNTSLPETLANYAAANGALMIHYSTDYVFNGLPGRGWREDDAAAPTSVYGRTKLDGDLAVQESRAAAWIFRVSWVYGNRGRNFLGTIRRLAAEGKELRIVGDQHGAPTWSRTIADKTAAALAQILAGRAEGREVPARGVYHMAAPDATTWFDFARAIVDATMTIDKPTVTRITTDQYPTPAQRPRWSVLDSSRLAQFFNLRLPPWQQQLHACLAAAD